MSSILSFIWSCLIIWFVFVYIIKLNVSNMFNNTLDFFVVEFNTQIFYKQSPVEKIKFRFYEA